MAIRFDQKQLICPVCTMKDSHGAYTIMLGDANNVVRGVKICGDCFMNLNSGRTSLVARDS